MNDNLIFGLALGFIAGAILVHSNQKANQMIEEGKEKIKETIDKI
ncbi:MAG: hypothetical protein ACI4TZ_03395 [Christensenellales bacterium]